MKKILMLLDTRHFRADMLDFAAYVAKTGKSKLVGIFIEPGQDSTPSIKSIGGQMYVEEITMTDAEIAVHNERKDESIRLFKEGCMQREVSASVHCFTTARQKDIIHETRYADLAIVSPALVSGHNMVKPAFLSELLEHAECPVMVAPEYFEPPEEIVFAYNGSRSSMFAIKQFCYQFPSFMDKKVVVLHVEEGNSANDYSKEAAEFSEWLNMHFTNVAFVELHGNASDALLNYFVEYNDSNSKMLVTGAFGRSMISSFLRASSAELVLKAMDVPVFIAHY